jgi:hypothetical protein
MTKEIQILAEALKPLADIADAFDANELDDDARKHWGVDYEHENQKPHHSIELFWSRGGRCLLNLDDAMAVRRALETMNGLEEAAKPMVNIARAYNANELDDDARKFWGKELQNRNETPTDQIEIYSGRGGKCLLTIGQAQGAHNAYVELWTSLEGIADTTAEAAVEAEAVAADADVDIDDEIPF